MSAPVRSHEAFGLNSQEQQLLWWDDFLGDALDDRWTSSGDAGGSAVVVDAQTGGIVRITTDGDDTDDWNISWNTMRTLLASKKVTIEYRLKLTDITNRFTRGGLQNATANQYSRFYFSTVDLHTTWHVITEAAGPASTDEDTGIALDTDYHIFRIELETGENRFYIDDVLTNTITTNTPTAYLEPYFRVQNQATEANSMDIDYVVIRQER